jgi:pyruvate/2-oxoglutarate dehydrogenase complex dihydrolipoamide acyltransferase (E2) component
MAVEILLPKLGLTMQEGTIEEWVAAPGTTVRSGDVLMRLATDKVDVEVEAEGEGLFHPAVPAGVTLPPGAVIGWLLAPGEPLPGGASDDGATGTSPSSGGDTAPAVPVAAASPAGPAAPVGAGGRLLISPNARRVARELRVDPALVRGSGPGGRIVSEDIEDFLAATPSGARPGVPSSAEAGVTSTPRGRTSSPLVRRYAESQGVDLAAVRGTGTGGRVRRADVDAALTTRADVDAAPAARAAGIDAGPAAGIDAGPARGSSAAAGDLIPFAGMRGVIAGRMHASLQQTAQLTLGYEAVMDAVVRVREQLKEELAGTGLHAPSLNDFVVRAAALALRQHPMLNATVEQDGIRLHREIHVGLAVAVPGGLMVPVIRDAADRTLPGLAAETRALSEAAREGRLSLEQIEGGTFAVTTLGAYGVDFFTPILNPGNVAILGVGRLRDGVAWEGEVPRRTRVLTLSLTFDHRAVDGAPAADYLRTVAGLLTAPVRLLAGY